MKKNSPYKHEDVDRALGRLAAEEGPSKAELVRRGLARLATRAERPRPSAIGFSDDGPTDLAANMDRYLHNQDSQNRPGQQIDFQGLVMIDARDKARQLEAEASDAGPVPAQTQRFPALRADEGLSPQPALVA
jgi:hypothetical protein